jgi:heptosyltransferase I
VIDKPTGVLDYWRLKQRLKSRHFDVLLAAQASFRANCLYACIRANRKIGYDRLRAKDGHGYFVHETITPGRDHTLQGFMKFAHVLGLTSPEVRWDLTLAPQDEHWARTRLPTDQRILVVNPAASKPERSWLVERYIHVIQAVLAHPNVCVVLTGGPGDADRHFGDLIQAAVPTVINLIGQTQPNQLLAVIALANCVLCPDTGPSHMAAAMGTPVVALHAVTNADVSGPYPFQHLAVNAYPLAVQQILGQTVDECVWGTHVHGFAAMQLIPVETVLTRVQQVLFN